MIVSKKSLEKFLLRVTIMVGPALILTACAAGTSQSESAVTENITAAPSEEQAAPVTVSPTAAWASPTERVAAVVPGASEGEANGEAAETAVASAAVEATPTRKPASTYADLEMVTLLPRDAIPAIDNPNFLSAAEAGEFYDPDELIIGVSFNGDTRAYSVPFLSSHEIVNDTVGGVKISVTW